MAKLNKEEQIKKIMESLGVSELEATEIVEFDNEEFELEEVQEMEQKAKKLQTPTKRGRKPKAETTGTGMAGVTTQTRTKKENPTKLRIMLILANALKEQGVEIDVKNPEKTILFEMDGNTFEIDLKQKRKPKA